MGSKASSSPLDDTKATLKQLNKYYQSTGPLISNIDYNFDQYYQLVKDNKITGKMLLILISDTIVELANKHYEAWNKTMSPKQYNTLLKVADIRNDSLVTQLHQKIAQRKGKLFVIAGGAHLLQYAIDNKSCQKVKDALKKYPFCIVTRAKFRQTELAQLNPDLQQLATL